MIKSFHISLFITCQSPVTISWQPNVYNLLPKGALLTTNVRKPSLHSCNNYSCTICLDITSGKQTYVI